MNATSSLSPAWRRPIVLINLGLLAALTATLSVYLWPEWRSNPDLSHGFFMPVLFVLLLHESRTRGPHRYLPAGAGLTVANLGLLALGLTAMAVGGLYAVALGWMNTMTSLALTTAFVLFGLAALTTFASESLRLIPFNWSALSALGLWLLCTPVPPGTYLRLSLALQMGVTKAVLHSLHLLGIAANRQGNIIELANTSVGIEEACSGVRSLISCGFAGLFFAACLVQRPGRRVLLVALAVPLAIGMNFLRSLLLTLLANRGVDISDTWHDITGFAILGLTALLLGGLGLLLADREPSPAPGATSSAPVGGATGTRMPYVLAGGLALSGVLGVFFLTHTRPAVQHAKPAPDLYALLPTATAHWQVSTEDLYKFRSQLGTDRLAQRSYTRRDAESATQLTVYLAYWAPGQSNPSIVATHTPDGCWPGAGWAAQPTGRTRDRIATPHRPLPEAEYRLFTNDGFPQYVWYWHLYDGRPIEQRNPFSPFDLLRMALTYGFRPAGDQLFVRVSSNRPWSSFAQDPLLDEIFDRLRPLGL